MMRTVLSREERELLNRHLPDDVEIFSAVLDRDGDDAVLLHDPMVASDVVIAIIGERVLVGRLGKDLLTSFTEYEDRKAVRKFRSNVLLTTLREKTR